MKNLFLTLSFVFATAFVFANVNSNETSKEEAVERTCVRTTLSCGVTGWACGETTQHIIENALAADEALCP
jgi:hypothetical protein